MNESVNNNNFIPQGLPAPDTDALEHSQKLCALIEQEIIQDGRISFFRFMELALYAHGLGYYSAGSKKLGESGDFITAPEISPLFSRCIARQCEQVFSELDNKYILEFGAGSGKMVTDILLELEQNNCLPNIYYIIETSAELKQQQHNTLQTHAAHLAHIVQWLDRLPEDGFTGVILANELLDAMPVHKFRVTANRAEEVYVTIDKGRFVFETGEPGNKLLKKKLSELAKTLPEHYESEINLAAQAWIRSIGDCLEKGLVLIIDYGYPQHEYYHHDRSTGTLMCYYRHHTHPDPFILPGLQDITAHVDFTAIAWSADEANLSVSGYTTQAYFLMGCGLDSMISEASTALNAKMENGNNTRQQIELSQQIRKLTLATEMGEQFKVLALTKKLDLPLIGFTFADQRARLLPVQ